jgi:hypothetical protein
VILKAKAKENGWTTLETISNRDQNKQNAVKGERYPEQLMATTGR